jgi:hypothetical protein
LWTLSSFDLRNVLLSLPLVTEGPAAKLFRELYSTLTRENDELFPGVTADSRTILEK